MAVWPSLDLAVTVTAVVPTGKRLPDAGVPVTVIGATPPDVVTLYVTATADPFDEATVLLAGQVTVSGVTALIVTFTGTVTADPALLVTWKEV